MLEIDYTKKFLKDAQRLERRGKNMDRLGHVVTLLSEQENIPPRYHNHKLSGNWQDYWELHIEPDWLLIYETDETTLFLARTGTHADLF